MDTIELKDFLDFTYLSDVALSPDGSRAAYLRHRCDTEKDGYATQLWVTGPDGHGAAVGAEGKKPLVAWESGVAVTYGLYNAQERGQLFIGPGVKVYEGMIVGVSPKSDDIRVNVCKKKHVTNMRAAGSDEALRLIPPKKMSLEECIEFINEDELLEITPKNIRMRKTILDATLRTKEFNKNNPR